MKIVGNDIVDLSEAGVFFHPRFPLRVLAEQEMRLFATSPNQSLYLWKSWAAKEASFKAIRQINLKDRIFPRELVLFGHHKVRWRDITLHVNFDVHQDYVHCVASQSFSPVMTAISTYHSDASVAVRTLARKKISDHLQLKLNDVEIKKDQNSIPYVVFSHNKTDVRLSLSHHGRFVAVAFTLDP